MSMTMFIPRTNLFAFNRVREAISKTAACRNARPWRMFFPAVLGLLLGVGASPVFAGGPPTPSAPANLRVDDVSAPVGTEAVPYFGWLDNDANANEIQTSYEILVATNAADLAANFGDVWDSGQVAGSSENHIVYAGAPLTSDTQYYWQVRTWNREGNAGPYSTNSTFEVGLLSNSDWSAASWIWRNTSASDDYTYYRKSASLPAGTITRATVYVSSVQKYALYVNGTLVGKGPIYAFPQYQFYNAYDITSLIAPGVSNVFAVFNHWFGGGSGRVAAQRGILMEAIIHYADGSSVVVGTDGTWLQSQATSWVAGELSRGGSGTGYIEDIDARNLTPTWNTNGFDDSAWANAAVFGPQPNSTFSGVPLPNLTRIVETVITPVSVASLGGNNYMVDLGRLYSGVPCIQFSNGTSGTTITMMGGFATNSGGTIDTSQNQTVNLTYYAVLNGSKFTYEPAEYETMRYFMINNSPMVVTTNNFKFIERNSRMNDAASSFTSSDTNLNAVWGLMKQTLPIDAQEEFIDSMRQKGGFLGDGYQESLAAMQVEDERVLTRSRLNEFIESMVEFWSNGADVGRVNACYPDDNNARDIPDYTQMYLDWVWEYYLQTGDLAFLNTNYTQLTNIAQYVNRDLNPANGLITRLYGGTSGSYTNGIIDWPPNMQFGYDLNTVRSPGNTATVIDGWAWEDYDIMSRIASEVGNTADSATYRAMANALQVAMNTNLLNSSGLYVDGLEPDGTQSTHASQHANAFPLSLNIVPAAQVPAVTSLVVSSNMSVSALGIIQLVRALGEANQGPALLNLFTNATQYGWAQILSFGGSATWESWTANIDGNSESHGWGAVGLDGYVRYILGIKPLTAQFGQVQIMPLDFGNNLSTASGTVTTDRGVISVEWDRSATLFHLAVTIPDNVTATIYVPQTELTDTTVNVDGVNVTGTLTNLDGTPNGYLGVSGIGSGTHNIQRVIQTLPVAAFSGTPTNGIAPLKVTFANLSINATNFVWNFGDGNKFNTTSNTNVTDTYTGAGSYTVILTATGLGVTNSLTNTAYIVVTNPPPPVAGFNGTPTNGAAPLTVTFSNLSSYATNYVWNFGDGNKFNTTSSTNVTDTYANVGSYTVSLTATGLSGTNSLTNTAYIVVTNPPPFQLNITNADNGGNLTAGASWIGGAAPGTKNIAVFDSTITGVHPAYATNVLGADTAWGEIQILNPAVPVQISPGNTLTLDGIGLNSLGIDMSHAANALTLNCPVALGASQAWLVAGGQTLNVNGVVSGAGLTINDGSAANGGSVIFGTQANTFGSMVINGGVVQLGNAASLGAGAIMINGGTMMLSSNGLTSYSLANSFFFTNTSIIDMDHSSTAASLNGAWSGIGTVIISNLDWSVSGNNLETLTMGGGSSSSTMNNFTGKIIVAPMNSDGLASQGTLRFNSGNTPYNTGNASASFNLGTNVNDAVFLTSRDGGTISLGELIGGPSTVLLGSRSTTGTTIWSVGGLNTSTTFAGSISNYSTTEIAALTKVGAGTLILTGTNTDAGSAATGPTGPLVVSGGTLQIGDGGADGTLTSGGVTITAPGILAFDRSDTYTVTNVISGTGAVNMMGNGTLILSSVGGANTYNGNTTVSAGTLLVNSSISSAVTVSGGTLGGSGSIGGAVAVQAGGTLAPGADVSAAGTVLTINSSLTLASGGASIMAVSHNNHTNDQVVSSGVSYGGTLTVITNAGDGPLVAGDTFRLFNSGTYGGSGFSATNLPALSSGLAWNNSLAVNGNIKVVSAPLSQVNITNADKGGNLTAGASWIGGVAPVTTNVAVFDSTITGVNPAYATNVLGADTAWGEIQILNPAVPVQISAGNTLTLSNLNSLGIDMSQAANALTLNCPVVLGASQTWLVANGQKLNVNGAVSGAGLIINNGSTANGTVILGAANTYTGGTIINAGVLTLGTTSSAGTNTITLNGGTLSVGNFTGFSPPITVGTGDTGTIANNATFQITGPLTLGANSTLMISVTGVGNTNTFTINGTMTAAASSTIKAADGTYGFLRILTPGGNANATFDLGNSGIAMHTKTAAATINLGALKGGPGTALEGSRSAGGVTTWSIGANNSSTVFNGTISNALDGANGTSGNATPVNIIKVGAGTLTLAGPNAYAGSTIINGGVLNAGIGEGINAYGKYGPFGNPTNAVGSIIFGGGTLQYSSLNNYDYSGRFSAAANQAISIDVNGQNVTFATALAGSGGSLTNLDSAGGGRLMLTQPSTYTGGTTVNGGTLLVNNTSGSGTGSGSVTVNGGGTLGGSGAIAGAVTCQSGGILAPGLGISAAGTVLTINSSLTLASGSASIMAVSHNNHTNDQIVSSTVSYGGTLTVITNAGDGALVVGDTFQLFNSGTYAGAFSATNLPALSPGLAWSNSLAINGSIKVVSVLPPPPVAGFSGGPTNVFVTQLVALKDASTGSITNWVWNYGDGNAVTNSSNASVTHAYPNAGSYTVSLTVSGLGGTGASAQPHYVVVKPKAAIGGVTLTADGKLVFSGTNGPAGEQYRILTTTDVSLPLSEWTPVWTNTFGADGSYNYTNTPGANPSSFFLLVSP